MSLHDEIKYDALLLAWKIERIVWIAHEKNEDVIEL